MAASLQGPGRGRGRYRPLAEINVTPLVDVMLVLLIIFMVTAPLMSSSVNVDLPKVNATPINQDNEPLQVSVNAQGQVFLMDSQVELSELVAKLQAIAQDQKDRRIFVRGDRGNTYGRMMEVMGTIIQGGFTKVSLLTEQVSGKAASSAPGAAPAVTAPAPASAPAPVGAAPRRQGRG
ncbi:Tol-Pal system protein TolR [Rhodovastum atsumiense]|uniref:Protein TolR n=1 Tax=Rhodovastum atsumiense TaxID=504468 RepID=A0A5M6IL77_9PROT|nr:protein TolR [Rhodovastum atsumiense]KAA5609021.1 protein TolR [Rhodovastum atsumiense]CAH2604659.1 Tol-Pal system protein TolR [Rhodovastum atsumiense]